MCCLLDSSRCHQGGEKEESEAALLAARGPVWCVVSLPPVGAIRGERGRIGSVTASGKRGGEGLPGVLSPPLLSVPSEGRGGGSEAALQAAR